MRTDHLSKCGACGSTQLGGRVGDRCLICGVLWTEEEWAKNSDAKKARWNSVANGLKFGASLLGLIAVVLGIIWGFGTSPELRFYVGCLALLICLIWLFFQFDKKQNRGPWFVLAPVGGILGGIVGFWGLKLIFDWTEARLSWVAIRIAIQLGYVLCLLLVGRVFGRQCSRK